MHVTTVIFSQQWSDKRYFIGLKDVSPAREHTPETISAKLEGFLELYRGDAHYQQ